MKSLKSTLLTLAALLCSTVANAYTFEIDGIYYNTSGSNATVTYKTTSYNSYSGDVVIPSTVTYNDMVYTVTSIGSYAFKNCSNLTSITIPESVTRIENDAFSDCSSLSSINIPDGVTSIGGQVFFDCISLASIILPESVTSIGDWAFSGCSSLADIHIGSIESWLKISYDGEMAHPNRYAPNVKLYIDGEELTEVEVPSSVTSIPSHAFRNCGSLISVTIPESVTSIGDYAFSGCSGLKDLIIEDGENDLILGQISVASVSDPFGDYSYGAFYSLSLETLYLGRNLKNASTESNSWSHFGICEKLKSVEIGSTVTNISGYTFLGCSSLASVTIPTSVTSIGDNAFIGCSSLSSITISEGVTSIGERAFSDTGLTELILKPTAPPALSTSSLSLLNYVVIIVPKEAYNDYCTAAYWTDLVPYITVDDTDARVKNLTLKASDDKSSLLAALGEENVKIVTDLTISGSINSYDFMVLRNKMPVLRHLDLSEASIAANDYEHYTGYHTEDNKFPGYGLHGCKLLGLELPNNITTIGSYAISDNAYLDEMVIPEGVTSIDNYAFRNCSSLTSIVLPEGVTSIGSNAFSSCRSLGKVVLPPTVKTIEYSAFSSCSNLTEIRIPSSIRSVGDNAFQYCDNLNDVYVYTVEPISIGQNTFAKNGNNFKGTLHAPKVSYWDYFYDTQWSQFTSFAEFDEPYENFYLQGDKVLDEETGAIEGEGDDAPDAEMGSNSGLVVEDDIEQDLGDVDVNHDGENGGSIIIGDEGCVNADELHVHINVQGGRWYFFCFPFDVRKEDIKLENGAEWVFRYYDGEERANNGKGGWKNVTSDGNGNHLKAATGYIFQCSNDDVLILTAKNQKLKQEKKYNELVEHVTANMHDASWNFVGNPYLSYYEVTSNDYSAPITVWDSSKYIAIRPGDDDYQLAPFEAFFVQKPTGVDEIEYSPEQQMTYHQSQEAAAQARARRRAMPINPDRLLVNITLSNGTDTDQTRVVFNNAAAMGYETTCDAAKFETAGVPQLYTIDSRAVKYAINERPIAEGVVTLGYSVPTQGNYTLAAPRMDTPVAVKDNLTGTIHNFSDGNYEFASEAGTFEGRFTVIMKAGETSIDNAEIRNQESEFYNVKGQRVENADEQGIYIKNNRKVVSLQSLIRYRYENDI